MQENTSHTVCSSHYLYNQFHSKTAWEAQSYSTHLEGTESGVAIVRVRPENHVLQYPSLSLGGWTSGGIRALMI